LSSAPNDGFKVSVKQGGGGGQYAQLFAPLHLPDGAKISIIEAGVIDKDPSPQNIQISFYKKPILADVAPISIGAPGSSVGSSPGLQIIMVQDIAEEIDNKNFSYTIMVKVRDDITDHELQDVRVTYTVERAY
jgi:hypothetical protein